MIEREWFDAGRTSPLSECGIDRINSPPRVDAPTYQSGSSSQSAEALRESAALVVTERVREIEPLLGDMYSRIDVHPAFRVVKFLASMPKGRGHLATVVSDPIFEVNSTQPAAILSGSLSRPTL